MKKIYLSLTLVLGLILQVSAQCEIDVNNNTIGMTPSDLGSFCVDKSINQVAQFAVPNNTNFGGFTFDFDSVLFSIKSESLPAGLNYSCVNGCKFYKTGGPGELSRGCVTISGTPTLASAPGKPDTLNTNIHVWANSGGLPYQYDQAYDIEIVILPANDPSCVTTGLTNFNIGSSLTLYPNPSKGKANIQLDLPSATNVSIEIYDVLGNKLGKIYSGIMSQGINTVSTEGLATLDNGMYLIKVDLDTEKGTRTYTERMIVK